MSWDIGLSPPVNIKVSLMKWIVTFLTSAFEQHSGGPTGSMESVRRMNAQGGVMNPAFEPDPEIEGSILNPEELSVRWAIPVANCQYGLSHFSVYS